jgi:putative ABC transport system permease protein
MTLFRLLYGSLLLLMPRQFRERHGAEALHMAAARVREEARLGRVARAARELFDLLLAVPVVRRELALGRQPLADPHRASPLIGLVFETRQALRTVGRARRTSAVAVLALGVSIGMSTAVFSIADRVLFRPLPYPAPERLVELSFSLASGTRTTLSGAEFGAARAATGVLVQVEGYRLGIFALRMDGAEPERLRVAAVTPGFLPLLGASIRGQGFSAEHAAGDGAPVAVVMHDYWRSHMGADPRVIGTVMQLDGQPPVRILGIVDRPFVFPTRRQSALPDILQPLPDNRLRGAGRYAYGIGRLKAGVPASAVSEAVPIDPAMPQRPDLLVVADPLSEVLAYHARSGLLMLFAGVVALLAVGVLDVSGLLVVQAAAREREIVTRRALGASTGRIARQLFLEGLLVAALSGTVGLLVAKAGFATLLRIVPPQFQVLAAAGIGIDGRALLFATAVVLVGAVAFGLAPLLHLGRVSASALRAGSGQTPGRLLRRLQEALVCGQVAGAVGLTIVGVLLVASFLRVIAAPIGFDADRLAYVSVALPRGMNATRAGFYDEALRRIDAIPGVESAALIDIPAMSGAIRGTTLEPDGRQLPESDRLFSDTQLQVTPGYFRTAGLRIIEGRGFTESDIADASRVAIVNQRLARRWFAGDSAVGQRLVNPGGSAYTIVGVVQDARHFKLKEEPLEEVFLLMDPARRSEPSFVVRAQDPDGVTAGIVAALRSVAPAIAVTEVQTGADLVSRAALTERFYAILLSLITATGLALAAVGLYAMLSWSVGSRRRELGLRAALGADRPRLALTIVRQAVPVLIVGVAAGALLGSWSTRLVRTLLYEVQPADPKLWTAALGAVALVALIAMAGPSRRALSTAPADALREE